MRKDLHEGSGNSTIASAESVSFLLCDDAIDFDVDGGLNPWIFMHFSETKASQGGCGGDDGDTSLFNVAYISLKLESNILSDLMAKESPS